MDDKKKTAENVIIRRTEERKNSVVKEKSPEKTTVEKLKNSSEEVRRPSVSLSLERDQQKQLPQAKQSEKAECQQPYSPVERLLQPDWFEDLRQKEAKERPRPTSIVAGVLYTSKALEGAAEEEEPTAAAGGATYSLIAPEVFETYDVCRSHPKAVKVFGVPSISYFYK